MNMLEKLRALAPDAKAPELRPVIALPNVAPQPWQLIRLPPRHEETNKVRRPVTESSDLARVLDLPRRKPVVEGSLEAQQVIAQETQRYRKPPGPCECEKKFGRKCILTLTLSQAWALREIREHKGLVGPIGVGHGKTGLDILAPLALDVKTCLLLVPPALQEQLKTDYLLWAQHWHVPSLIIKRSGWVVKGAPALHVLPYSKLSRPESAMVLKQIAPDAIIADEAHKLRYRDTATTSRVLRYLADNSSKFLCWSGTLTDKSIKDYAHLAAFALREGSPLPLHPSAVEEWAKVIDPSDWPAPMGELARLCHPGEHIYEGFRKRLVETPGVVSTKGSATGASLYFTDRKPKIPTDIALALGELRQTWTRPDGEELVDALALHRCARELACGFYYKWVFPRGESKELQEEWLAARKAWHKELRQEIQKFQEHKDSRKLCENAAERFYEGYVGDLPVWKAQSWPRWSEIKDQVKPKTVAVWVDDFVVDDAARWGHKERGIIWFYKARAFGERLAEKSGLPLHVGGGAHKDALLRAEDGSRSIVVSINSRGTGWDGLQNLFCTQLVANPPVSPATWEQLLGRLHRIGQEADEVTTVVYRHTPELQESIDKALKYARYVQGTMGQLQKLLASTTTFGV